jgi:hypothetical protein
MHWGAFFAAKTWQIVWNYPMMRALHIARFDDGVMKECITSRVPVIGNWLWRPNA